MAVEGCAESRRALSAERLEQDEAGASLRYNPDALETTVSTCAKTDLQLFGFTDITLRPIQSASEANFAG